MRVTVLGSGHGAPTRERASAGALVRWNGHALLLDASAGTYVRALRAGLDPAELRAVVLSHFHVDHTGDLAGIFWALRRLGREEIAVVGPEGTADVVARYQAVYPRWQPLRVEVHGFPYDCAGAAITAFPAVHSEGAVCVRIEAGNKVLGYSGDTEDCPGVRDALRGADLALLECTWPEPRPRHLSPACCDAILADARPQRVLLTHLGDDVVADHPLAEDGLTVHL